MTEDLVTRLCGMQNRDGGWGYGRGPSWTEPTAMVLLALRDRAPAAVRRGGIEFLIRQQRSDGGWRPKPGVEASTWVTAFGLLTPGVPDAVRNQALKWLLTQSDRRTWFSERLRAFLLGQPNADSDGKGWSFYPGTAGWATPTAMSLIALRHAGVHAPELADRAGQGIRFLLAHRCSDGGWNHGNARALGYDLPSYPETTGQALLALAGQSWADMARSLTLAEKLYEAATSAQAAAWLELGLRAHGRTPARMFPTTTKQTLEAALLLILDSVRTGGHFVAS